MSVTFSHLFDGEIDHTSATHGEQDAHSHHSPHAHQNAHHFHHTQQLNNSGALEGSGVNYVGRRGNAGPRGTKSEEFQVDDQLFLSYPVTAQQQQFDQPNNNNDAQLQFTSQHAHSLGAHMGHMGQLHAGQAVGGMGGIGMGWGVGGVGGMEMFGGDGILEGDVDDSLFDGGMRERYMEKRLLTRKVYVNGVGFHIRGQVMHVRLQFGPNVHLYDIANRRTLYPETREHAVTGAVKVQHRHSYILYRPLPVDEALVAGLGAMQATTSVLNPMGSTLPQGRPHEDLNVKWTPQGVGGMSAAQTHTRSHQPPAMPSTHAPSSSSTTPPQQSFQFQGDGPTAHSHSHAFDPHSHSNHSHPSTVAQSPGSSQPETQRRSGLSIPRPSPPQTGQQSTPVPGTIDSAPSFFSSWPQQGGEAPHSHTSHSQPHPHSHPSLPLQSPIKLKKDAQSLDTTPMLFTPHPILPPPSPTPFDISTTELNTGMATTQGQHSPQPTSGNGTIGGLASHTHTHSHSHSHTTMGSQQVQSTTQAAVQVPTSAMPAIGSDLIRNLQSAVRSAAMKRLHSHM